MSRKNAAPTVGWVFMSQVNKWLAITFLFVLIVVATIAYGAYAHIDRTCSAYSREWLLGDYRVSMVVSDSDNVCGE